MSLFLRSILFSSLAITLYAQSDADVVSIEELRNPLAGRALRTILAAEQHLKSGRRERGMNELREALRDPAAMPYAIAMMGAEHLKAGQIDIAISELTEAVRVLPGRPESHANLAYALYFRGQTGRALKEVRRALQLDGGRPKTRLVLGMLLLQQGSHDVEAVRRLQAAAQEAPGAHLILARRYERAGRAPEAEQERRAYTITSVGALAFK